MQARGNALKEPGIITDRAKTFVELRLKWTGVICPRQLLPCDGRFAFTISIKGLREGRGASGYVRREFERDDFPESGNGQRG
jgi:hypothetical protein